MAKSNFEYLEETSLTKLVLVHVLKAIPSVLSENVIRS